MLNNFRIINEFKNIMDRKLEKTLNLDIDYAKGTFTSICFKCNKKSYGTFDLMEGVSRAMTETGWLSVDENTQICWDCLDDDQKKFVLIGFPLQGEIKQKIKEEPKEKEVVSIETIHENYIIFFGKYRGRKLNGMLEAEELQYCSWVLADHFKGMSDKEKEKDAKYRAFTYHIEHNNFD